MRKRRIRDIVIELTSLLDVVMILIFAVMIENSRMVKASEEKVVAANATIEEMQDELYEAAAEKDRITEDFTAQLENREEKLKDAEEELARKNEELESKDEDLLKANEAYDRLSNEKDEISKDLKIAQRKLAEGDIEELLAKIANANRKIEGFEYLSNIVTVYNVGVESIYTEDYSEELYRVITYGKTGTDKEDKLEEFTDANRRAEIIEHMNAYLVKGIDEALKDKNASVYIIFSYHGLNSRAVDTNAVQNALVSLSSMYEERVYYSSNRIND